MLLYLKMSDDWDFLFDTYYLARKLVNPHMVDNNLKKKKK